MAFARFRQLVMMKRTKTPASVQSGFEYAPDIARAYGPHLHDRLTSFTPNVYYAPVTLSDKLPVSQGQKWFQQVRDAYGRYLINNEGGVAHPTNLSLPSSVIVGNAQLLVGPIPRQQFAAVSYANTNTTEQMYGIDT